MAALELVGIEAASAEQPQPGRPRDQIDVWRAEVDDSYTILRSLDKDEPEELFAVLAGVAARVAEIRTQLTRMESRRSAHFRTQEIDPLLAACEFQFKCWSRLAAVRSMDQQLSGRAT